MNMGIASMLKLFAPLTMRCSRMSIEGPPLTQSRVMQLMPMEECDRHADMRQTASSKHQDRSSIHRFEFLLFARVSLPINFIRCRMAPNHARRSSARSPAGWPDSDTLEADGGRGVPDQLVSICL